MRTERGFKVCLKMIRKSKMPKAPKSVYEIKRHIPPAIERELWARAAGRCQFNGCNKIIYKSSVTQERVNLAEKAHIYSFSPKGPRGMCPYKSNRKELNSISNLLLVCHGCHETIDQDKAGLRYSAELLMGWKSEHEKRVKIVTGIAPDKKSHVVLYGAKIGDEKSPLRYSETAVAMFPNRYPADENPIHLSMDCEHEDRRPDYWKIESKNLRTKFDKNIVPRIEENNPAHFSLFALAPQPLLIYLGALFTDKRFVDVYQLHREPKTWEWQPRPTGLKYIVKRPVDFKRPPVLMISLSDRISKDRIRAVLGNKISVWELTINDPHNDFLKSKTQLSIFRETVRKLMVSIKEKHGHAKALSIFPAMPVSCAVELGRVRMPKAEMPWIIYDQNNKAGKFLKSLEISGR